MKPSLGEFSDGSPCLIDVQQLLETRALIQANSGGGKSRLLRRLLEQTQGHVQQLVIDPEGEFSTLREKFDYVIAAPHDGDALAHPKTAQLLALRLLETGVSAILDIYDLKAHERQSFVRIFCETLIEAPKSLWRPALIVLDEAHVFNPEVGNAEASSAVIDLATRGRKRGFALIAATQRLAKLHKDTAAELFNKMIGRTGLDVDVKRAAAELGMTTRDAMLALRALTPGEFYAMGPAFSPTVQQLLVGDVVTTHPKAGQRALRAPPRPTAKIRAVLPKLADLPKEAETEARTIEDLRRELNQTRRALADAQRSKSSPAPVAQSKFDPKQIKEIEAKAFANGLTQARREAEQALADLKARAGKAFEQVFKTTGKPALPLAPVRAVAPPLVPAPRALSVVRAPAVASTAPSGDLSGPEQRILDAIAWLETMIGGEDCEQTAVAFLARYSYGGGAYNNPRGRLHSRALVEYLPNERIRLTAAGRALANAPSAPLSVEELHRHVLARLGGPEQRILKPLLASFPQPMEGTEVAAAAGYAYGAGSFNNPRGRLRSLGLIEYLQGGQLIASASLFGERTRRA
jgi:uncharacterized protein